MANARSIVLHDAADLNRARLLLADFEADAANPAESWWDYTSQIEETKTRIAQLEANLAGMP